VPLRAQVLAPAGSSEPLLPLPKNLARCGKRFGPAPESTGGLAVSLEELANSLSELLNPLRKLANSLEELANSFSEIPNSLTHSTTKNGGLGRF